MLLIGKMLDAHNPSNAAAYLLQISTAFLRRRACYGDDFLIVDH